jgi:hypothetical protein
VNSLIYWVDKKYVSRGASSGFLCTKWALRFKTVERIHRDLNNSSESTCIYVVRLVMACLAVAFEIREMGFCTLVVAFIN